MRIGWTAFRTLLASTLIAGCGSVKDSGGPIDAPTIDSPPMIDADTSGNATVTAKAALFGQTGNIADVDIISTLPNNMPFATAKTAADGTATIKVFPGGTVTAAYKHTNDMGFDFISFVDVKPGDHLEFGNRQPQFFGTNTDLGTQTYSWPALATATGGFRVQTSCTTAAGAAGTTASNAVNEFTSCHREPFDALFVAFSTGPTTLVGCNFRNNVTYTAGANTAIGGWATPVNATANLTGIPSEVSSIAVQFAYALDGFNERVPIGGGSANGAPSGGAFTGNFLYCTNVGERTSATAFMSVNGNFGQARVLDFLPSNAASWTVSNPQMPPWVEGTFLTSAFLRTANWVTMPSSNNASDTTQMSLGWNVTIGGTGHNLSWHFIMPPTTKALVLPKLPASFDAVMPQATCSPSPCSSGMFLSRLRTIEIPTVSNYDAIRALPASTIMCPECAVRAGEVQRIIVSGF